MNDPLEMEFNDWFEWFLALILFSFDVFTITLFLFGFLRVDRFFLPHENAVYELSCTI